MSTIILTFFIFLTVVAAMAVGVIVNGRAIKGSCGGLNDIEGLGGACDICEGKKVCEEAQEFNGRASRSTSATSRCFTQF